MMYNIIFSHFNTLNSLGSTCFYMSVPNSTISSNYYGNPLTNLVGYVCFLVSNNF